MVTLIDLHCHVLPHLDDGAADWDEAAAMARMASGDGITACVATPHWTGVEGEAERVRARIEEFRIRVGDAPKVHAGHEVILVPKLVRALQEGGALTLAGSSYVLLETAQLESTAFSQEALFRLQANGYRVVLAHPERLQLWQQQVDRLRELIERGCFLQVNAGSLAGGFGPAAKSTAEALLKRGWVSLLASDAHSSGSRPPLLTAAVARCTKLIGEAAARVLVCENPARILCNETLPWIETERSERRRRFSFPWSKG